MCPRHARGRIKVCPNNPPQKTMPRYKNVFWLVHTIDPFSGLPTYSISQWSLQYKSVLKGKPEKKLTMIGMTGLFQPNHKLGTNCFWLFKRRKIVGCFNHAWVQVNFQNIFSNSLTPPSKASDTSVMSAGSLCYVRILVELDMWTISSRRNSRRLAQHSQF